MPKPSRQAITAIPKFFGPSPSTPYSQRPAKSLASGNTVKEGDQSVIELLRDLVNPAGAGKPKNANTKK
jgi:hypothetical protein